MALEFIHIKEEKIEDSSNYLQNLGHVLQYGTSFPYIFILINVDIISIRQQMKSYQYSSNPHLHIDDPSIPIIQRIASRQCQQTEAVIYSSQIIPYYAYNGKQINPPSYSLSKQIAKLRRILVSLYDDHHANRYSHKALKISSTHPIIYFEYIIMFQHQIKYVTIAEVIKRRPQLRKNKRLFYQIYDKILPKVGKEFQCIAVFADNLSIRKGQTMSFYYQKAINHKVQFIIFDSDLKGFEFNGDTIQKKKNTHKNQFVIYERFIKSLQKQQKIENIVNIFHKQEAESDEEQKGKNIRKTDKQLKDNLKLLISTHQKEYVQRKEQLLKNISDETQSNEQSSNYHRLIKQLQNLNLNWVKYNQKIDEFRKNNDNNDIQQSIEQQKRLIKKTIITYKEFFSNLPIFKQKSSIIQRLNAKEDSQIIVISSKTGSGKSTQLPQILCEYFGLFENQKGKPILVTQPTKMAVRNLAERVSKELEQDLGSMVDYATSQNKAYNKEAKIIFKLDSLAVTEMIDDPLLSKYSCLLIDEAHQRTLSIDILLGFVKEIVKKRPQFKVIISSASLNVGSFERYFNTKSLSIQGNNFPVNLIYKDFHINQDSSELQSVIKIQKILSQQIFLNINETKAIYNGHILCFCSNIEEISILVKRYRQCLNPQKFSVHSLHHRITTKQQKRIFKKGPTRKLIFASKIAETAITIDDIGVVVDLGLDTEFIYDRQFKISTLKIAEISQSSAKQRLDNAIRSGPGYCFRLYSSDSYKNRRQEKIPQIQNSSLETVILKLKSLKIQNVQNFPFMSQINKSDLEESIQSLQHIGALDEKQQLSLIGTMLVRLPVDSNFTRVIIQAILFDMAIKMKRQQLFKKQHLQKKYKQSLQNNQIAQQIVIIIAMLSNYSNLTCAFSIHKLNRFVSHIGNGYEGDFLLMLKLYQQYDSVRHYFENQQQYKIQFYNMVRFNSQYQQIMIRKNRFGNLPQYQQYFQAMQPKRKFYQKISKNHYHSPHFINQVNQLNYPAFCDVLELIEEIRAVFNKNYLAYNLEKQIERVCCKLDLCTDINQIYLSCIITSFGSNLCKFSGNKKIGYVSVKNQNMVKISPNSCLHKTGQQICDWIISYDYEKDKSDRLLCNIAQKVSIGFIEKHIDKVLLQKLNIQNISQNNLYSEKTYSLPTKILHQIRLQISKQSSTISSIIMNTHPSISEKDNTISFYLLKQSQQPQQKIIHEIEKYINKMKENYYLPFTQTYSKNIIADFKDGLQIKSVQFKQNTQVCYEITAKHQIIKIIQQNMKIHSNSVRYDIHPSVFANRNSSKQKIQLFLEDTSIQKTLLNLIQQLKFKQKDELQFKKTIVDRQKQQTIIYLYFYAGISDEKCIYIHYGSSRLAERITSDIIQLIQIQDESYQSSLKLYQMYYNGSLKDQVPQKVGLKLKVEQIKLSDSQQGVNIQDSSYDEYQILEELKRFYNIYCNMLDLRNWFPVYITSFREPVQPESLFTDEQWSNKIKQLIKNTGCETDDLKININGFCYPLSFHNDSKKGINESLKNNIVWQQVSLTHRVNMVATIQTKNTKIFEKLKTKYDNKIGVLGFDKLHVQKYFCDSFTVDTNLFQALEQNYQLQIKDLKQRYPTLIFSNDYHSQKFGDRVTILISSQQKSHIAQPLATIQNIFRPKLLTLTPLQFKLLRDTEQGQKVRNDALFDPIICCHLQLNEDRNQINIYCNQHNPFYRQICSKLKMEIMSDNYCNFHIEYDGINLHKIIQIFQDLKKEKGYIILYQVSYQNKQIMVTSKKQVQCEIMEKIKQIPTQIKDGTQCHICFSSIIMPYKMINCQCTFCWNCISAYVESTKDSSIAAIYCPSQECRDKGKVININDIRYLVTEQVFKNLCRLRIKKYGMEKYEEYQCCRYCDYFFSRSKIIGDKIFCESCEMYFCLKCQKSHNTFTCEQFQSGEYTKKLGVKRCPRCRQGIQKNEGCDHMVCTRCRAQICWRCMRYFQNDRECVRHVQSCGRELEEGQRE